MKQLIAVLADGRARFATLNGDELTEIAQVRVPDSCGLEELALLGTTLIEALGLDDEPIVPVRPKAPKAAKAATSRPQPRGRQPRAGSGVAKKSKGGTERYITFSEVMDVIGQHPEGVQVRDIADVIHGNGEAPYWVVSGVQNRIVIAKQKAKREDLPLPFREVQRPYVNKDGKTSTKISRYLVPMPSWMTDLEAMQSGVQS